RPTVRTAALLALFAPLLAAGAVKAALALDAAVLLAWMIDIVLSGRLGFVARPPSADLVFAVDAARLPRESVRAAQRCARGLGALVVGTDDLPRLDLPASARLVLWTDALGAGSAPSEALVVLPRDPIVFARAPAAYLDERARRVAKIAQRGLPLVDAA